MAVFGRLDKVAVREGWLREDSDFTPWLAKPDNLASLGAEIGIPLELVEIESGVGQYYADILAKHADSDEMVVIENQFGSTNHSHLGQLLTYASGVGSEGAGAKTIIWIAEQFNEPHRAALDWLNKSTEPGIRFFGVEIELWRIGDSPFAPKFSVVSRPNDWQKKVSQETGALTATELLYQEFWSGFFDLCAKESTTLQFSNSPRRVWWLPTKIDAPGFGVNLNAIRRSKRLECQLWIEYGKAKEAFAALLGLRGEIVAKLGSQVEFDEMPGKYPCKIFETKDGDVTDREQWPAIYHWLKERGEAYATLFKPLVSQLRLA